MDTIPRPVRVIALGLILLGCFGPAEAGNRELEQQREKLIRKIQATRDQIAELKAQVTEGEKTVATLTDQVTDLDQAIADLKAQLADARTRRTQGLADMRELAPPIQRAEQAVRTAEHELEQHRQLRLEAFESREPMKSILARIQTAQAKLKAAGPAAMARLREQPDYANALSDLDKAVTKLNRYKSAVGVPGSKIGELTTQIAALKREIAELETKAFEQDPVIQANQAELDKAKTEKEAQLAAFEEALGKEARTRSLLDDVAQAKRELKAAEQSAAPVKQRLDIAERDLTEADEQYRKQSAERSTAAKKLAYVERQLRINQQQVEKLYRDVDNWRDDLADLR